MGETFEVALTNCYFCGKGSEIVLNTRFTKRAAAAVKQLHGTVIDMDPCNECKEHMKAGIVLITIDATKSEQGWEEDNIPNPYRTGGFFVVKEEAVERLFNHARALEFAKKHRWLFIEHDAAMQVGLFAVAAKKEG